MVTLVTVPHWFEWVSRVEQSTWHVRPYRGCRTHRECDTELLGPHSCVVMNFLGPHGQRLASCFYFLLCPMLIQPSHSYTVKDCSWRVTRRVSRERRTRGGRTGSAMSKQFCALVYMIVCCACTIDLSYLQESSISVCLTPAGVKYLNA